MDKLCELKFIWSFLVISNFVKYLKVKFQNKFSIHVQLILHIKVTLGFLTYLIVHVL